MGDTRIRPGHFQRLRAKGFLWVPLGKILRRNFVDNIFMFPDGFEQLSLRAGVTEKPDWGTWTNIMKCSHTPKASPGKKQC